MYTQGGDRQTKVGHLILMRVGGKEAKKSGLREADISEVVPRHLVRRWRKGIPSGVKIECANLRRCFSI